MTTWAERASNLKYGVHNFLDGRKAEATGNLIEKACPRDGQVIYRFGSATDRQLDDAVMAARCAFEDGRWSRLSPSRRREALHRLASLVESNADELALLDCIDVGKPIFEALTIDVPATIATIRFNAESIGKHHGRVYGADPSNLSYQLLRPIGVVGAIIGWNFPLLLAAVKIGPALAAGNCIVLKPSELTPLSALRLAELAVEAGIPAGVLNVITGDAIVGAALGRHEGVDMISFTGSSQTGKQLLVASGKSNMKRLLLECGGKAPNIVFDDSPDLDAVAEAIVSRAFWNQGQVCTASSRLLVHTRIRDDLLSRIIQKTDRLALGDPFSEETRFGAVVGRGHKKRILEYIAVGRREGADLIYQSSAAAPFEQGFYVPPAILGNVKPNHRIAQEEIFGPVLSVMAFSDDADAIRLANSTIYGLSAIIWTQGAARAHRIAQEINAGLVVINATSAPAGGPEGDVIPVGGHKQSGIGVEGGLEGIHQYLSSTSVQMFV